MIRNVKLVVQIDTNSNMLNILLKKNIFENKITFVYRIFLIIYINNSSIKK